MQARPSHGSAKRPGWRLAFGMLALGALCCILPTNAPAAAPGMHGPRRDLDSRAATSTSDQPVSTRRWLLAPIRFFQRHISPIDGPRCQFAPTCSSFGHQAIRDQGFWLGGMMTADRLLRCSPMTAVDQYPRLPNGRLADPVANNLLED